MLYQNNTWGIQDYIRELVREGRAAAGGGQAPFWKPCCLGPAVGCGHARGFPGDPGTVPSVPMLGVCEGCSGGPGSPQDAGANRQDPHLDRREAPQVDVPIAGQYSALVHCTLNLTKNHQARWRMPATGQCDMEM